MKKFGSVLLFCWLPCFTFAEDERKEIKGITIDREGNPVGYVEITPKWRASGSRGTVRLVMQNPEKNGSGQSDYEGKFSFTMMADWWEGLLAYNENRTMAGVAIVPRKEAPRDLTITMEPATEVTVNLVSSNQKFPFRFGNFSIFYRPDGTRYYSMIHSISSANPCFHLPPGKYEADVTAGTMYGRQNIQWEIVPGQKQLDLGEVVLPLVKWADQPDSKAPPLSFSDIRGLSENTSWDSLRGKWVYLNFWAHWCGPCQRKMKDLVPWYLANQEKRDQFEVIFIHASDAKDFGIVDEKMPALAGKHWGGKPFPFPMMLDADREITSAYGVRLFPTEILVDPSGKVVTFPGGPGAFDELKTRLRP